MSIAPAPEATMNAAAGCCTLCLGEAGPGGGTMTAPDPGIPPHWLPYVAVDDLAAATQRAKDLGATMIMEKIPVADYGRFTIFKDPTGAVIAMWHGTGKM